MFPFYTPRKQGGCKIVTMAQEGLRFSQNVLLEFIFSRNQVAKRSLAKGEKRDSMKNKSYLILSRYADILIVINVITIF